MNALSLRNLIVDRVRDLDPVARLTLHVLARFADAKTCECWPSQETIAAAVGVSDRTIRTALATLKQRGFIAIVGRRKVATPGAPRAHVLRYRITLDDRKQASGSQSQRPEAGFRPSRSTTGKIRHDDRKQASADDRKPTSDKQIKENRSRNRSPTARTRARGEARRFAISGGLGAAEGKKTAGAEDVAELEAHFRASYQKHRGVEAKQQTTRAASKLLEIVPLVEAKAAIHRAWAKGKYFDGSLWTIVRNIDRYRGRESNGASLHQDLVPEEPRPAWAIGGSS